ncbi:MAG TPA: adenosine deaminase [Leptospiraceae bacterium]|nr:adenosine deaminase [Leptospiraceae bacterium]HMW04456.1 adenosine deaminase [Leptospiraceae bacterium]HMX31114.1 adenosine deaminase [Leptospiraceae bacterium]HMY30642.1 adenosine deaminase [Leptospiraceae bacterium]HMZ65825.1 adenosine deaminase [Leptospiraceae bacterium]
MQFVDLHNHLYGSISAEKLFEIGKRNPNPRWQIFTELYSKIYNKNISTETFFEDYSDLTQFKELFLFNKRAPFIEFQSKFNLIIALSRFDEEEIFDVSKSLVIENQEQGVCFVEFRIMYPPNADQSVYQSKTIAACRGLQEGEKITQNKTQGRLVVSLHRDGNFLTQYEWLKDLMRQNELVQKYLVGLDFCYIEEGFPPIHKKTFFEKVLEDNQKNPKMALSILYHVGESFSDKTPKSAVRWIGESALYGAHRLGHAIALGINPEIFKDRVIEESVSERMHQLEFELKHYEEIRTFGRISDRNEILKELDRLKSKDTNIKLSFAMNKNSIDELYTFQEFMIYLIREKTKSVIECCPTSNLYIGMLPDLIDHPIRRFVARNMKVTIGTDDSGIFDTTLPREYNLVANTSLPLKQLEDVRDRSAFYKSEILSGRSI